MSHLTPEQNKFHTNNNISARNKTHFLRSTAKTFKNYVWLYQQCKPNPFLEYRFSKTWQSFHSTLVPWADNITCWRYGFTTRAKTSFKAPNHEWTYQLLLTNCYFFFYWLLLDKLSQILEKFTSKWIMRILWSEPWKAVLMNFSADTLKFFVDLETGHRLIFNPLLLLHATKSSLIVHWDKN